MNSDFADIQAVHDIAIASDEKYGLAIDLRGKILNELEVIS